MGRKGSWFSSVKKAFSPKSKRGQKSNQSEKSNGEENPLGLYSASIETVTTPAPTPQQEKGKLTEEGNELRNNANFAAAASISATEAAVDAPEAAKEIVPVTIVDQFAGRSKEEVAALKIQTAFRGYLARRALRALRGLVRLKSVMEGLAVKRQTSHTLRHIQTLSRVQSQICSRRMRMAEENQALQKQLLQKHVRELERLQIGEEWDDSLQSKEQIEAKLLSKYEAATRRERALAYAFTHQQTWKNSSRSVNLTFMDPSNPSWGWSWLERWMAARPLDSKGMTGKDLNSDNSTVKGANRTVLRGEISKAYARYQLNHGKLSPTGSQKTSQPAKLHSPSTPSPSIAVPKKVKSASPRVSTWAQDDDTRSTASIKSYRRHSMGGSSVRDDESLASSQALPSYMAPTKSARAKLKSQSPFGSEMNGVEKGSVGAAKKRLSFPSSPARPRRHSGPPNLDTSLNTENGVSNGGYS